MPCDTTVFCSLLLVSVQLFKGKYYDYNHYSDFTNGSAPGGLSTEANLVFNM